MQYKEYLKQELQSIAGDKYKVSVYDEIDFNFNPKPDEIVVIVQHLSGSVIGSVKFVPIQLQIYSASNEVNNTSMIFNTFVASHSNTHFTLGIDYYKQDYSTPVVMDRFGEINNEFRQTLIVTGSLVITSNISDIKEVYIDGELQEHNSVNFALATNPVGQKGSGEKLSKVYSNNTSLSITITMRNNSNLFNNKLSLIKLGKKSVNDKMLLKFVFTDNERVEEYSCRVSSLNDNYDITNPPTKTVTFTLA